MAALHVGMVVVGISMFIIAIAIAISSYHDYYSDDVSTAWIMAVVGAMLAVAPFTTGLELNERDHRLERILKSTYHISHVQVRKSSVLSGHGEADYQNSSGQSCRGRFEITNFGVKILQESCEAPPIKPQQPAG